MRLISKRFGLCTAALALTAGIVLLSLSGCGQSKPGLVLYCAAGIMPPVKDIIAEYEKECGIVVQPQYGGSGQLLSNIEIAPRGDLYLAADSSYVRMGRSKGLLAEVIPIATQRPVIAVPKGNPKGVRGLEDLCSGKLRVVLANPDQAAIGRTVRDILRKSGQWDALEKATKALKPTVNDAANDVKIGSADASIIWDATVKQYPELEMIRVDAFASCVEEVSIAVLRKCEQPAAALHFARFMAAPERGLAVFRKNGFEIVDGDTWESTPAITMYSGGVYRVAVDATINQFVRRENCRVKRVYNGCGILVSQMKTQQKPDAYLACDVSFVPPVADLFLEPVNISETDILIAVQKDNPRKIHGLADLAQDGLRVGLANPEQSTLGALTKKMLEQSGLLDGVMKNVRTQSPTADILVNQAALGSLDAVVVYEANIAHVKDKLTDVRIPAAKAVQPFAIGKESSHKRLVQRLLNAITSEESQKHYESLGFKWRAGNTPK